MTNQLKDQIHDLVTKQFDGIKVTEDQSFLDLGDEFDHIELIMKLEEAFEVSISDEEAKNLLNINAVITFLQNS